MFTKEHYETIAHFVSTLTNNGGMIVRDDLVEHLSDYFQRNNPNFDRDKFYKACYRRKNNNG